MALHSTIRDGDDHVLEAVDSEVQDAESSPPEYEISTYPADFTLQVLFEKWKSGDIIIPPFQRQFVWTLAQASKLIESFLLGLPVPSVFLYTERRTENFLVIDGQQRLKTIFYFFEGFFGEEVKGKRPVFRLKGLSEKSRWWNKTFADLEATDEPSAKRLLNSVLRAFVVKQLDPKDDTSVYHIFERLNTGGTLLKGQEIRNCVYAGTFNEFLKELNQNADWRAIFGKRTLDNRMRDVELILRFFALREGLSEYDKPMKDFLSRFMNRHRKAETQLLDCYRSSFVRIVAAVHKNLGPKPFHIRAGLNAAVYDAVFVALAAQTTEFPSDLKTRHRRLVNDSEFVAQTSAGTTDVDTVKKRIAKAKEVLWG